MKEKEIQFIPIQRSIVQNLKFKNATGGEACVEKQGEDASLGYKMLELLIGSIIFWIGPVACGIAEILIQRG